MALKDLPQEYVPQLGDVRSESKLDGSTFALRLYTGETWADLAAVNTDEMGLLTDGLTLLGRSQGEQTLAYTWRAETKEQTGATWWAVRENRQNKVWRKPRFGLGELVWRRVDPLARPKIVTGIILVQAYHDDRRFFGEDEDESSPQSWLYYLNDREEEMEEDYLIGRSELAAFLAIKTGVAAVVTAGDGYDPFLDGDDLP